MSKSVAEKISRDVEATVDDVIHDLRRVRKHLGAGVESAVVAVNDLAADARDGTQALAKTTVRTIRARPITALAIAAGLATLLGFVIGMAVPRRR
jgi:ElaB/YqjD/DUF883 family membrane-anchored ribosome-binding protein